MPHAIALSGGSIAEWEKESSSIISGVGGRFSYGHWRATALRKITVGGTSRQAGKRMVGYMHAQNRRGQ